MMASDLTRDDLEGLKADYRQALGETKADLLRELARLQAGHDRVGERVVEQGERLGIVEANVRGVDSRIGAIEDHKFGEQIAALKGAVHSLAARVGWAIAVALGAGGVLAWTLAEARAWWSVVHP